MELPPTEPMPTTSDVYESTEKSGFCLPTIISIVFLLTNCDIG